MSTVTMADFYTRLRSKRAQVDDAVRLAYEAAKARHASNPDYRGNTNVLSRSRMPVKDLPPQGLRELGYLPAYVAVPERGQSQWRTYRHPDNNFHFHRHGDDWIFHEDSWPSLSMVVERLRQSGVERPYRHMLNQRGAFQDVALHSLVEGVPGYLNYIHGGIMGRPTFQQLINGQYRARSKTDTAARAAAMIALAGSAGLYAGRPRLAGNLAGGTAGFLGGVTAGNILADRFSAGHAEGSPAWAASRATYGALLPLLTTVGGSMAGRRIADVLLDRAKATGEESASAQEARQEERRERRRRLTQRLRDSISGAGETILTGARNLLPSKA